MTNFYNFGGFVGSATKRGNLIEVILIDGNVKSFERWAQAEEFMWVTFGARDDV